MDRGGNMMNQFYVDHYKTPVRRKRKLTSIKKVNNKMAKSYKPYKRRAFRRKAPTSRYVYKDRHTYQVGAYNWYHQRAPYQGYSQGSFIF